MTICSSAPQNPPLSRRCGYRFIGHSWMLTRWPTNVSGVLTPFVNDDTFIAARVDVAALPAFGSADDLIKALPMLSTAADAQSASCAARVIEGVIKRFRKPVGRRVYIVAGLADLRVGGGPLAIASCQPGKARK